MLKYKNLVIVSPESILSFHWEAPLDHQVKSGYPGTIAVLYDNGKNDFVVGKKEDVQEIAQLYSEWKIEYDKQWGGGIFSANKD